MLRKFQRETKNTNIKNCNQADDCYRNTSGDSYCSRKIGISRKIPVVFSLPFVIWRGVIRSIKILAITVRLVPPLEVPPHLQCAVDRANLRNLYERIPVYFLMHALTAMVAFIALFNVDVQAGSVVLVGVIGIMSVWSTIMLPRVARLLASPEDGALGEGEAISTFRKVCPDCPEYRVCARSNRVDYRPLWRAVLLLNAALGIVWAFFVLHTFSLSGEAASLFAMMAIIGLLASVLATSAVENAVEVMTILIVGGAYIALLRAWHGSFLPNVSAIMQLTLCSIFVVVMGRLGRRFRGRLFLATLEQREQAEIVSLLMRRSDSQLGEWLWHTDSAGCVYNPSARFAKMFNLSISQVQGRRFVDLLDLPAGHTGDGSAAAQLAYCITHRLAFRELRIRVMMDGVPHWWTLTGRPIFSEGIFLGHRGVGADVTKAHDADRKMSHDAHHDMLTGLPNNLGFSERLHESLLSLASEKRPFALLMIGIDGLESVPQSVEVDGKERLLQEISGRLGKVVHGADFVSRRSADEFLVLCPGQAGEVSNIGHVQFCAQRIIEALELPFDFGGEAIHLKVSIGIALAPETGDQAAALMDAAADALQEAMNDDVEHVCIYDYAVESVAAFHRILLEDVRSAVRNRAFQLVYQPIVNAQTLQVQGFEALARLNGPSSGRMSIERIIRVIEADDLCEEFDLWVLETACNAAMQWPETLWVSVNISAPHFMDPGMLLRVTEILKRTGLPSSRLQLEMTETIFLEPRAEVFSTLAALNKLGVRIVLDDFGKGFSSLSYLKRFPFSKIKLDAVFVQDMLQDARSAAVVRSVLELAVDLGVAITAEGVATDEQYQYLREKGCTEIQGYLFSRPIPEKNLAEYLAKPFHGPDTAPRMGVQSHSLPHQWQHEFRNQHENPVR